MGSIIVALDCNGKPDPLLEAATTQAIAFQDEIYFIHIVEASPDFVGFDVGPDVVRDQMAKQFHKEHSQLQEVSTRARSMGCKSTALLLQGPIVDLLVDQGKKLKVRLLIAGSHGRGRVHQAVLGSTVNGLIRKADFPVLIVPARG